MDKIITLIDTTANFTDEQTTSLINSLDKLSQVSNEIDKFKNFLQQNVVNDIKFHDLVFDMCSRPSLCVDNMQSVARVSFEYLPGDREIWNVLGNTIEGETKDLYPSSKNYAVWAEMASLFSIMVPEVKPKISGTLLNLIQEQFENFTYNDQLKLISLISQIDEFNHETKALVKTFNDNLVKAIKEVDLQGLFSIYGSFIVSQDKRMLKNISTAVERRFYDLSSQIKTENMFGSIVSHFGHAHHQSDNLWNFLTKITLSIIEGSNQDDFVQIVSGYSEVQRGSNQLWDTFISKYLREENKYSVDSKILMIKALVMIEIPNRQILEKGIQQVLSFQSLQEVYGAHSYENLAYILNNCNQITDVNVEDIETMISENWDNIIVQRKHFIKQHYLNTKRKSVILERQFKELEKRE